MELVKRSIDLESKKKILFSKLHNFKEGDLILLYYSAVGDTTKIKDVVGIYKGSYGRDLEKNIKIDIIKGKSLISLRLFLRYTLFYDIRILKKL